MNDWHYRICEMITHWNLLIKFKFQISYLPKYHSFGVINFRNWVSALFLPVEIEMKMKFPATKNTLACKFLCTCRILPIHDFKYILENLNVNFLYLAFFVITLLTKFLFKKRCKILQKIFKTWKIKCIYKRV